MLPSSTARATTFSPLLPLSFFPRTFRPLAASLIFVSVLSSHRQQQFDTEEDAMLSQHFERCHCAYCASETDHPDRRHHQEMRAFLAILNHEQRRLYAAIEANRLGR